MLTELRIKNFAIIESLTLPLARGFNVLSGETGAGKSIIVGALSLLVGERATADLIRSGADRAVVEGAFDVTDRPDIQRLLDERGIEAEDGLLVLRREIAAGGRGRAWINGSAASASLLADIGRSLVNLHGQHEAQTLLEPESQRRVLDEFAGVESETAVVGAAHRELTTVRREIESLSKRQTDAEARADYLRHVANEIDAARLQPDEDVRLEEEARRLEHGEELRGSTARILAVLSKEDASVLTTLSDVERSLHAIQRIDSTLAPLQEVYDTAYYALDELARALDGYARTVELDPERLDEVRRRRDLLFRLCKKYGGTVQKVVETGQLARAELELLDSAGLDLQQLRTREDDALSRLTSAAAKLSVRRKEAAKELGRSVETELPELGMDEGRFSVHLITVPQITAAGAEDVEFRVALNVGHQERALSRVASGGELSRVMLALRTILARLDRVPTLVFDEVDAGIGGRVGLQVGRKLRRVAGHHQVFAITHLPQIAAQAHHHIVVSKAPRGGVTTADISVISGTDRVAEVARMLGGDGKSEVSRAHAGELLGLADSTDHAAEHPRPGVSGRTTPRNVRKRSA